MLFNITTEWKTGNLKVRQCHWTNLGNQKKSQSITSQLIVTQSPVKQKKKEKKKSTVQSRKALWNILPAATAPIFILWRDNKKKEFFR